MTRQPPRPTPFPYTTLFRSVGREVARAAARKADDDILEHSLTLLATRQVCGNPQTSLCKSTLARLRCNADRSEEHTSELQSLRHLVCRLLLEKKKKNITNQY